MKQCLAIEPTNDNIHFDIVCKPIDYPPLSRKYSQSVYWKTPQFAGSFRPAEDLFCLVHNFITKSQKPLIFSKIVQLFEFSRLFWAKIQITGTIFWNQHPLPFFAGTPFQFSAFCIFFSSKIHRFYVIVDLLSIYFNCVSIALLRRNNQHVNLCIWINIVIIT